MCKIPKKVDTEKVVIVGRLLKFVIFCNYISFFDITPTHWQTGLP